MRITTRLFLAVAAILAGFTVQGMAQEAGTPNGCPQGLVCISREAALKALADADRVAALEKEIAVKDAALASFRENLSKIQIEFARCSGEATGLRTAAVRDAALIELLTKLVRPKKNGLIVF